MRKVLFGLFFCSCVILTSQALEIPSLKLELHEQKRLLLVNKSDNADWNSAELNLFMLRAGDKEPDSLPIPLAKTEAQQMTLVYEHKDYQWQIQFEICGAMLLATSSIKNLSNEELRLEPGFAVKLDSFKKMTGYWDGFGHTYEIEENNPIHREGIKGEEEKHVGASNLPFPVAAVFGNNSSLFIGSVLFDPISYTASSLLPDKKSFTYSIRIVLSPGQTLELRQTVGQARTDYGAQEAIVQQYYESFPECWQVVQGQENPYIWGNHAHYETWWGTPKPEKTRRLQQRIEWCYCPYKRSGDMLGKEKYWDYQAKNPFRSGKPECGGVKIDYGTISAADYRQHRQERFKEYARKFGWMFYNTTAGTWCEFQLAQEHYPDSITHDKSVMYILNSWSTHHDQEIRVFPMATSFAKDFESDLVTLASELDLPGFALDCAYGGAYYRGPAVNKPLPGRAWDDEGLFIDQSVAINHQVDFIHNIQPEPEKKLTAFINGYLKGDYVMVEAPYLNTGKFRRWMPLLRWYIGPRPGCVHGHGFIFQDIVPDWRNKSPEYFQELMPKLSDFVILNQFKYGLSNSYLTMYGNPQQIYIMPEAFELMRAGWQAEIPVILEEGMRVPYISRYGKGVNTYFFLGNSGAEEVAGKVSFDSTALTEPGWQILFNRKMRQSASCTNQLDGKFSHVNAVLPSRVPVIYEAVAAIQPNESGIQCEVQAEKALHYQTYRVLWKNSESFGAAMQLRRIRGFVLDSVLVDGKTVNLSEYQTPTLEFQPNSQVEINYKAINFHVPAEQILDFPFTDSNQNLSFKVQIAEGSEEAATLAQRFSQYFDFCREHKVITKDSPEFQLQQTAILKDEAATIVIFLGDQAASPELQVLPEGVSIGKQGALIVKAKSAADADKLLDELFLVMDQRFEYIFPFRYVMGLHRDVLAHFNMLGKAFPYHKYFEVAQ